MARSLEDIKLALTFDKANLPISGRDITIANSNLGGMQPKWKVEGYYIKEDTGRDMEGLSEVIVYRFISCIRGIKYVPYFACKIKSEDKVTYGCYSLDFKRVGMLSGLCIA